MSPLDTPPPAQRDLTESHVIGSMVLGAAASFVFYLVAVHGIFAGSYASAAFSERGLIPYLTTFLAGTGLFLLLFAYLRVRREELTFEGIRVTLGAADPLDHEAAPALLDEVRGLRRDHGGHIVANRFLRALHSLGEGIKSKSHLGDLLRDLADFDMAIVQAAHLPVRYIIWLIPVLGFTGTVLGISSAISGFSNLIQGAGDFAAARGSLGEVALNLGVAFETTLLALIKTAILMYAFSLLQKRERSFFIQVDEYCADDVLQRVVALERPKKGTEISQLTAAVAALTDRLAEWDPQFESALDRLCARLDGLAAEANAALGVRVIEFGGHCDSMASAGSEIAARHLDAAEAVMAAAEQFAVGANRIDAVQTQLAANVETLTRLDEFSRCLDALQDTVERLPEAVRELTRPRQITLVERPVGRPNDRPTGRNSGRLGRPDGGP